MRFKILGPLVVEREGEELHLGGSLQRIVMALLLLEANRVVPLDRMIEAAWGEASPGTARNQIQIRVSQLRKLLDDDLLITRTPGYVMRVAPGMLDLAEFDDLVARAQREEPAQAVRTLREALALWRGPALSDVESDLIRPIVHDLEERRLLAHERCIELELGLGRHHQLVGELRRLVQHHPLRELLHSHLMLALYRSGRQAEALEVFHAYREMLLDTLGLEPGDELRKLQLAVLNQESLLDSTAAPARRTPTPRQLPPMISMLSGRESEMRLIQTLVRDGHPRTSLPIAAIVGRAGVGKTELALQVAHHLADAFPDGQLYIDLRGGELQPTDVLSRFLRALGVSAIPRTADERCALFRSTVAGSRILVLLDNAGSFDQVWPLLPGGAPCAVLVTSRERPVGLPEHQVLRLGVLDQRGAVELLSHDVGALRAAAEPAALTRLAEQCGGLPLALRIAGARLAVRPQWTVETLVGMLSDSRTMLDVLSHGDREVRASLNVSYRGLSQRAQTLFRRIGLLGCPQISTWLGAALLDDDVEGAFEELVDASLLQRRAERYGMHDLVRAFAGERALAEDCAEVRQAAIERACGTFLLLADRAHQRYYGGHFTLLRGKAADGLTSEAAADTIIGAEPPTWLDDERATLMATVRQAAAHGLDELCWNIAMTAITLFETHGYFDEWRSLSEIALASCRAAGNLRGEGAMVYALSSLAIFQQRYADARPLLLDAIEIFTQIGEVHGKALALRNLALSERVRGDVDSALERFGQALDLLRAVGDRAAEAHVLINIAAIHMERDQSQDAEPLLELALTIFRQEGVPRGEAQALSRIAELALRQGSGERALEAFEAAALIVRTVRDRIGEAHVLHGIGAARLSLGQVEQAEKALLGSLEMARGLGERLIEGRARLSLGVLLNERGSPEGALQLEQAHELFAEMEAELWRARAAEALARTR